MTTDSDISGTWTPSVPGNLPCWVTWIVRAGGAGGQDGGVPGGGGGSGGCYVEVTTYATSEDVFVATKAALALKNTDGNLSKVTKNGATIGQATGGKKGLGATGGVAVTTGCVGDVITAGGNGVNGGGGLAGAGGAGGGPDGGAGGTGTTDDGFAGTAPGGGGEGGVGGGVGNVGGQGAPGRVDAIYPVDDPNPITNQTILSGITSTILSSQE